MLRHPAEWPARIHGDHQISPYWSRVEHWRAGSSREGGEGRCGENSIRLQASPQPGTGPDYAGRHARALPTSSPSGRPPLWAAGHAPAREGVSTKVGACSPRSRRQLASVALSVITYSRWRGGGPNRRYRSDVVFLRQHRRPYVGTCGRVGGGRPGRNAAPVPAADRAARGPVRRRPAPSRPPRSRCRCSRCCSASAPSPVARLGSRTLSRRRHAEWPGPTPPPRRVTHPPGRRAAGTRCLPPAPDV